MSACPVIVYWPARGLLNATRLLLEHVGQQYKEEDFAWNPVSGAKDDWSAQKFQLGLPFPNLPYVKDGDTVLTQSDAVIRYFARKHGLVAKTEEEHQQEDVLNGVCGDLREAWGNLVYGEGDFVAEKLVYWKKTLEPLLQQFDKWLTNKDYLVGSRLNYLDFVLFELLDVQAKLYTGMMNNYPNVKKFHEKIAGLKGVKEFMASGRVHKSINAPSAKFGG